MKQSKTAIDAAGDRPESRRGVAIVLVLGLLATLMLMAVAFSISMRIERRGAGNLRTTVQARHMLWAALANAIEDVDADLRHVADAQSPNVASKPLLLYPDWANDIMVSTNKSSSTARLLSRDAIEYVPDQLHKATRNANPEWRIVRNEGGRYAYMVINKSGLLDANMVGDSDTIRWMGVEPAEIRVDQLPEIQNANLFSGTSKAAVRIETLPELRHVFDGNGFVSDSVESFEAYSRAIGGEKIGPFEDKAGVTLYPVRPMVPIGDGQLQTTPSLKIVNAFTNSGLTWKQANLAALNLLDYSDADSQPQKLNDGCVERVPMINEVVMVYHVDFQADKSVVTKIRLFQIEWMYPFVLPPAADFTMRYKAIVTPDPANSDAAFIPNIPPDEMQNTSILGSGLGQQPPMYAVVSPEKPWPPKTAVAAETNGVVKFKVEIKAYIEGPVGPNKKVVIVDAVPWPYEESKGIELEIDIPKIAAGEKMDVVVWAQVIDPRFNWDPSGKSGNQWLSSNNKKLRQMFKPTPRELNEVTQVLWDPRTFGLPEQDFDYDGSAEMRVQEAPLMHVADTPLQTVGELGHICYDQWSTIRLYDHGKPDLTRKVRYHKVFDYFTVHEPGKPLYGLVNCNTTNISVLAAVFYKAPRWAIGKKSDELKEWGKALAIADQIIASGPYTNLSDICHVVDWDNYSATEDPEIAREGLVRNSVGLLTVRQNHFTIIVKADAYSLAMGGARGGKGATLASVHAIADVWRDPFPFQYITNTVDGMRTSKHKTFIRYYRMLEE